MDDMNARGFILSFQIFCAFESEFVSATKQLIFSVKFAFKVRDLVLGVNCVNIFIQPIESNDNVLSLGRIIRSNPDNVIIIRVTYH